MTRHKAIAWVVQTAVLGLVVVGALLIAFKLPAWLAPTVLGELRIVATVCAVIAYLTATDWLISLVSPKT